VRRITARAEEQVGSLLGECAYSVEFDVVVHKFLPGARICLCGEIKVLDQRQLLRAGWYGRGFNKNGGK